MISIPKNNSKNILNNLFVDLYEILNPDYFIEIGAFECKTSNYLINKSSNCKFIAFEANYYNYEKYKNSVHSDIHYLNKAVSNNNKTLNFYIKKNELVSYTNSLHKRKNESIDYIKREVEAVTIDSVIDDKCKNAILWIDVEGHGYEVCEGINDSIDAISLIKIEVENKVFWNNQKLDKDVINLLLNKNFVKICRDYEYEKQYNILFLNKKYLPKLENFLNTWYNSNKKYKNIFKNEQ